MRYTDELKDAILSDLGQVLSSYPDVNSSLSEEILEDTNRILEANLDEHIVSMVATKAVDILNKIIEKDPCAASFILSHGTIVDHRITELKNISTFNSGGHGPAINLLSIINSICSLVYNTNDKNFVSISVVYGINCPEHDLNLDTDKASENDPCPIEGCGYRLYRSGIRRVKIDR